MSKSLPSHGFSSFSLCSKKASLTVWKAGVCWWWWTTLSSFWWTQVPHKPFCHKLEAAGHWCALALGTERSELSEYGLLLYVFMFPILSSAPLPPPFFPSIPSPSLVRECQFCPDFNEDPEIGGLTGWLSGTRIHLPSERRGFDPWSERSPGEVNGNPL